MALDHDKNPIPPGENKSAVRHNGANRRPRIERSISRCQTSLNQRNAGFRPLSPQRVASGDNTAGGRKEKSPRAQSNSYRNPLEQSVAKYENGPKHPLIACPELRRRVRRNQLIAGRQARSKGPPNRENTPFLPNEFNRSSTPSCGFQPAGPLPTSYLVLRTSFRPLTSDLLPLTSYLLPPEVL